MITRRRELTGENGLGGRVFQKYESADRGLSTHVGVEGELEGFGFTAGFTARSFGDLRAGRHGDPAGAVDTHGRQDPTGYREKDFSFSLIKRVREKDFLDLLVLESRQEDVPRSDRLIPNDKQPDPPDLMRSYDPQVLRWYALRFRHRDPGALVEAVTLTASLDNPREGRKRVKASAPGTLIEEEDEVTAPGFSGRIGIRPSRDHLLAAGVEGYFERVDSRAETRDLAAGTVTPRDYGRYPDGARYRSLGVYVQDEWKLSDRLSLTNGLRYSCFRVNLDLEGLEVGPLPPFGKLSENYDDVTVSSSLSGRVGDETLLYGTVARGFRSPNLHDLATMGDFASGNRIPNLNLDPESVWNFEAGARHGADRLKAGGAASVAFYEDIFDDVYAFSSGGEDYFRVENASRAVVYFLESWIDAAILAPPDSPRHSLFARAFLDVGRDRSNRQPLSKVPPPGGTAGYRVEEEHGAWFAEAFLRGALDQHRLSASDEEDPRIPEGGTPGWWTVNLRGGLDLSGGMRLLLSLENLLDKRYRIHGSGIDAPGFNVILSLDWRF